MVRKLIVFIYCAGLFMFAVPRPVNATCGTPTPTATFTLTPSPTPTLTPAPTPDANGYIPPSPMPTATFTPSPTNLPTPVGTRVAALANSVPVIAEGEVIFPDETRAGFYHVGHNQVIFAIDRYYQGNGPTILKFNYFVDPCNYGIPPFIQNPSGIFFFGSRQFGAYEYRSQLPANDEIRASLTLVSGAGQPPREAYATGLPLTIALLGFNLLVGTLFLWRLLTRR